MRASVVPLLLVLLCGGGCAPAASRDAGTCTPGLALAEPGALVSAGDNQIVVLALDQTTGLTVTGAIELEDGGAVSLGAQAQTGARTPLWDVQLPTGTHTLTATASCGELEGPSARWSMQVHPRVELTQTMPRSCRRLLPATAGLDCDGVVIDEAGRELPGFARGSASRAFRHEGDWGRWVVADGGLLREHAGARTSPTAFDASPLLVVTADLAFSDGQLVLFEDGGLTSVAFGAGPELDGPDFAPCAAATQAGQHAVAWCFDPFVIFFNPPAPNDPFVVCEVSREGVKRCERLTGVVVRQDLRTGVVTLRDDQGFFRFDLVRRERLGRRAAHPGEETHRPPTQQTGDGVQGAMNSTSRVSGFLGPDPAIETFTVREFLAVANTEFVWVTDAGVTTFARLSQ